MKNSNMKFKNIKIELFKDKNYINDLDEKMGITRQELNNTKYTLDYLFKEYDN